MKNQQKMNERELSLGLTGTGSSWHREYDDSAWVYVGGLPYDLTEGDVICIFSQYVCLWHYSMGAWKRSVPVFKCHFPLCVYYLTVSV